MRVFLLCLFCAACGTEPIPASSTSKDTSSDKDLSSGTDVASGTTTDGSQGGDIGAGVTCIDNWAQGYCVKFTFHGGKVDGRTFTLQHDLTGTHSTIIYGDTHMQPPAVALAIDDHWQLGQYKDPLEFQLVFGNLVEAPGFPAFLPKAGTYDFSCKPPYVQINYKNIMYRSTCPGLKGSIVVTQWTSASGEQFLGHFQGTLQQYLYNSKLLDDCSGDDNTTTCKVTDVTVDVEGTFGLTLPAMNSDLAP